MTTTSIKTYAITTMAQLREQAGIVVPVYQRHDRWVVERCRRLLDDIRAAGKHTSTSANFIGSILATHSGDEDSTVLTLHLFLGHLITRETV